MKHDDLLDLLKRLVKDDKAKDKRLASYTKDNIPHKELTALLAIFIQGDPGLQKEIDRVLKNRENMEKNQNQMMDKFLIPGNQSAKRETGPTKASPHTERTGPKHTKGKDADRSNQNGTKRNKGFWL